MGNGIINVIVDSVLNVIYSNSETCVICKSECFNEEILCSNCLNKIQFYNNSFKINNEIECFSSAYYTNIIMELVRRLKYKSDFNAGEVLGQFLINLINLKEIDYDLITFVPMTKKSLRARGFNQSRFLAMLVGRRFHKPVLQLLKKTSETKDQIGLDSNGRWENLKMCFKVCNKKVFKNKKVLLIDDVVTTGATAFYCSKELLNNGAEKVTLLTAAKSRI